MYNCLPDGIKQRTLLYCTDNAVIQQIKKNFVFEWNVEDYAETTTSGSKIYFFKDNRVVFQSPIILTIIFQSILKRQVGYSLQSTMS